MISRYVPAFTILGFADVPPPHILTAPLLLIKNPPPEYVLDVSGTFVDNPNNVALLAPCDKVATP